MRSESDSSYVIGLCDAVLRQQGKRGHRFDFLRGDAGHRLPVDAYYQALHLVINYRERRQSDFVVPFDMRLKARASTQPPHCARYDQRRRDVLPSHGITLIEFDYKDFQCDAGMRLRRIPEDLDVVRTLLFREEASRSHAVGS